MNALRSLHGRLLVALLLVLGTLWAAVFTQARHDAATSAAAEVDGRLRTSAVQLLQLVVLAERSPGDAPATTGADASSGPAAPGDRVVRDPATRPPSFEIVWEDGRSPVRSPDFPTNLGTTSSGFEERSVGGRTWRVLTVVDRGRRVTGRIALDDLARGALAGQRDREAIRPLLWILPLFAIAALASVWFGLAPLRRLERSIDAQEPHELASLGLDPRRLPRELGRLVAAIESLLARLRDIQHRQRAFAAMAGHELRTPLAGCSAQLQLARRTGDAAVHDRALGKAERSIETMARLVGQLLVLARVEARTGTMPRRRVDLAELVANVVARRRRNATEAGLELGLRRGSPEAFVHGNPTLLECMVDNLVDNAIKFSPRGTAIDLRVDVHDERVTLRVLDGGPGVPDDERDRVFDPFHRVAGIPRQGSGLGLPTVRAVVADHGGEVRLQARTGPGTEARVVLPAASTPVTRSRSTSQG